MESGAGHDLKKSVAPSSEYVQQVTSCLSKNAVHSHRKYWHETVADELLPGAMRDASLVSDG